jgi:hypothetical protein
MSNNHNASGTELKLRKIQDGISAVLTSGKTLPMQGKTVDATALGQLVSNALAPYETVNTDRQNLRVSVAARNSGEAGTKQLIKAIRTAVANAYGEDSSEYQSFGFTPRKKAVLTSAEQSLKVERALSTRLARGTKGKVQKQAIKGVVNAPAASATPSSSSSGNQGSGGSPAPK